MWTESHSMQPLEPGLSHPVQCSPGPSLWLHTFAVHSGFCWVIFHCTKVPQFADPFTTWRAFGFLPNKPFGSWRLTTVIPSPGGLHVMSRNKHHFLSSIQTFIQYTGENQGSWIGDILLAKHRLSPLILTASLWNKHLFLLQRGKIEARRLSGCPPSPKFWVGLEVSPST